LEEWVGCVGAGIYRNGAVKLILRSAVAILTGILSSVIVHFAALEYLWNSHAANSRFETVFFALGSFLAGPGFEAQSAVVLINVIAFAVFFSVASFLLLRRRAIRQKL
jgi:hypothetical protein